MKTFTDFRQQAEAAPDRDNTFTESRSLIRKGAAAAFTLQSRNHSKSAQSSFKQSLTALTGAKGKSTPEKLDALCEAFGLPHRSGPTRMLGLASVSSGVMPPFLYRAE